MEKNIREIWKNGNADKVEGYRVYINFRGKRFEKKIIEKEKALLWCEFIIKYLC
jgi:hypothetical protein